MADHDADRSDALQRAKQAQAHSWVLREQVARVAEAIAETEDDVARLHRQLAAQGGRLAAEAREHADRAEELAAEERAEAERLRRRSGPG
jgi:septal ring factor EnvC (AmiA/AmiB activator)